MNGPITQDWKTVVIKGKASREKQQKEKKQNNPLMKNNAGKNKNTSDINTKKLDETEIDKIETVSLSLSKQIQQGRLKKKLNQKEFAKKLNMPQDTIKKYENGTAIPKGNEMQKMSKLLGIILKKNSNKKK